MTWELMPNEKVGDVVSPVSAVITTLQCQRITETNGTFISYEISSLCFSLGFLRFFNG